ncbi:hypothetical protein Avbf_04412, partial [Armadillidium vulgare]
VARYVPNKSCFLCLTPSKNVTILPTNFYREGKDISGYNLEVDFHQCKYSTKSCFTTDHVGSKHLRFDASCVFIGIIMKDRDKLYGSMSDDCLLLSTAIRKNIYEIIVDDPECFYDEKFPPGNISMKFYYSKRQPHEALTLILPCTSGGT